MKALFRLAMAAALMAVAAPVFAAQAAEPQAYTRLIVGYKTGTEASHDDTAAANRLRGKGRKLDRRLATGAVLVDFGGLAGADAMRRLLADPDVAYVEPDLLAEPLAVPNDSEYIKQWDLFEAKAGMNVEAAWERSTGSGVTVAVLDTGHVAHSDLAANIVDGYDFVSDSTNARDGNGRDANPADEGDWRNLADCSNNPYPGNSSWHGTHVAGTIAASTNNGKGIAGVAYQAKIQPVRVLARCGGSTSDIADAIVWASGGSVTGVPANKTPAKVINMSLGGKAACSATYQNAINTATGRGTTVVVSAGNSGDDVANYQPAGCDKVISVAASDRDGNKASYSNHGAKIDVTAPGGETDAAAANGILSTLNNGATRSTSESYAYYQGTSMAAPHIAGLAALVLAKKSSLTPAEVEQLVKDNVRTLPGTCTGGCGSGLADADKTVRAVTG